jgi:hypothetical protein
VLLHFPKKLTRRLVLIRVFQLFASDGPYIVSVVDDEPILGPLLKQPDKHKLS